MVLEHDLTFTPTITEDFPDYQKLDRRYKIMARKMPLVTHLGTLHTLFLKKMYRYVFYPHVYIII